MKDLKEFRYPKNLNEAIDHLRDAQGKAKVIAGGTSLTLTKDNKVEILVDISRIGLDYIKKRKSTVGIGACVTARDLTESPLVSTPCLQALCDASETAGPSGVRAALTIGGNVVQCYPWSDLPVALLALGAKVKIAGNEPRKIHLTELFERHPSKSLERDEIVKEFSVPIQQEGSKGWGSAFVKISRTTTDYALATAAAWVNAKEIENSNSPQEGKEPQVRINRLRIVVGAVRPMPVVVEGLDSLTKGEGIPDEDWIEKAGEIVLAQVGPIADMRASVEYRNRLIKIASTRALKKAIARATKSMES